VITSKLSVKGQSTIPGKVRQFLGLKAGDSIGYEFAEGQVVMRKVQALDAAFLRLASESFSDWNSPEADEAFRDL
jgi:bifunctional DNA-binding transcriptional regulator/antitoxin component of YhaV-PrlF toxin-antitoxin module